MLGTQTVHFILGGFDHGVYAAPAGAPGATTLGDARAVRGLTSVLAVSAAAPWGDLALDAGSENRYVGYDPSLLAAPTGGPAIAPRRRAEKRAWLPERALPAPEPVVVRDPGRAPIRRAA